MAVIIGLLTFLLVLTLPLLIHKLLPRSNPTTLIAIAFFTALIMIFLPFILFRSSPFTNGFGFLSWLYYPFSVQQAPNDHSLLLVFGRPFQEYSFGSTAIEVINFVYTFTALAGIIAATYIHARLGQYPVPQYPSPLKPPDESIGTEPVTPLPWDYRVYCIMAAIATAVSIGVAVTTFFTFSSFWLALLFTSFLGLTSLILLMIIHLYWKIGTTNETFSAPLMTHRYTLGFIFATMAVALFGSLSIPYDPRLKNLVWLAVIIYLGLSSLYILLGHAVGPKKWGVLDD